MNFPCICVTHILVLCWIAGSLGAQMGNQRPSINTNENPESLFYLYQRPVYPKDCNEILEHCSTDYSSGVYLIKPEGYPEPFEVYCDKADSQVWTVIQRRMDGSLDFNRYWTHYKNGFGFLHREYWMGNRKLSHLTNQKKYQLLINLTNSDGTTCSVTYDAFRIDDERGDFKVSRLGQYFGNPENCFTICPINMGIGNCSCQRTCEDPYNCHDICAENKTCVCSEGFYVKGEDCVPAEECGCYDSVEGAIIPEGDFGASASCSRRAHCSNGQLSRNDSYMCSPDAVCEDQNNVRQCYCRPDLRGDRVTCAANDCLEFYNFGSTESGIYTIHPPGWSGPPFQVYCNMTDGGGWTTFQRRVDGTVDFYRNWTSYKEGFGSLDHEHWLGNDKIHYLTNQKRYTIRIDLVDNNGNPFYAKYDFFRINNEDDFYRLSEVGTYSGDADTGGHRSRGLGYSFSHLRRSPFSTYDRDNDASSGNCAEDNHGAWWYKACGFSSLNAEYNAASNTPSIRWSQLPGADHHLKFTEMKIRPFDTL